MVKFNEYFEAFPRILESRICDCCAVIKTDVTAYYHNNALMFICEKCATFIKMVMD